MSSSSVLLMDSYMDLDAPLSSFTGVSPRLAERAAPAAFCCAFDFAGIAGVLSRFGVGAAALAAFPASMRDARIRAEVDSVDAIRELVMNGAWATIMPCSVFWKTRDRANIRISQISGAQLGRLLMLARRTEKIEAPEIEMVQNLIQAELERL